MNDRINAFAAEQIVQCRMCSWSGPLADVYRHACPGDVRMTLDDRTKKYGEYKIMAACAQNIKSAMWNSTGYSNLPDIMRESLEMIALKMARIISGDATQLDNWHDIQGYAKLIEDRLQPIIRD